MYIAAETIRDKRVRTRAFVARGFSLIELAIAMFIFGLVISSILGPAADLYERNKNADANQYLDRASRAVMEYALRNRTAYREITYDGAPAVIPAGRPYLPCPDTDGDGIENRTAIGAAIAIGAATTPDGACTFQKGTIPWRTLQLSPIDDPWKNHLTYHVDFAYSNALFGFDETSRADRHDFTRVVDPADGNYEARATRSTPFVVCEKPNPTGINCLRTIGGITITAALNAPPPYGEYDHALLTPDAVVKGVVFVLVSHGPNGRFARSRDGVCNNEIVRNIPGLVEGAHEKYNALQGCGLPNGGNILQGHYYSYPASEDPGIGEFDDLLRWVMADELMGALSDAGITQEEEPEFRSLLPIPKLQFLP